MNNFLTVPAVGGLAIVGSRFYCRAIDSKAA